MVDASSLQCCSAQVTLPHEQLYVTEHCLDEESTVEEVLVISVKCDQGIIPVPFCNTPYLFAFWRADMLIDHISASEEDNQYRFAL